ncbi:RIPP2 protein, partial [Glareola pratincola]|nr:RIPP2 protein [Glareola pratincola]
MSRGRWAPQPPAIKTTQPGAGKANPRRMEGGGTGCGCPRRPKAALPPPGYSPLSSSPRCGPLPGSALALLPLPRRSAPFWRPWVPTPGEGDRRSGPGPGPAAPHSPRGLAEASRKLAQYTHPVR